MVFKDWLKEQQGLLYYSFVIEPREEVKELKTAKVWFYITIGVFFYGLYTSNLGLILWMMPAVLLIYLIRQKQEGRYKHWMMKDAIFKGDDSFLTERYEKYKVKCGYASKAPLNFEDWKTTLKQDKE